MLKVNPDYAQAGHFPEDRASALVYRSAAYNPSLNMSLSYLEGAVAFVLFYPLLVHQP